MANNTLNFKEKLADKFFEDDYLEFRNYPDKEVSEYFSKPYRNHIADFTNYKSPSLAKDIKTFLRMIFMGFNDFSYLSNITKEAFYFIQYMEDKTDPSILGIGKEELKEAFIEYRNVKYHRDTVQMVDNIFFFLTEFYDKREGLDRDVWYLDRLSISEERINKVSKAKTINFSDIENVNNRELIKKYIRYQLGNTELAISTISNHVSILRMFSNYYQNDLTAFTEKDAMEYVEHMDVSGFSVNTRNRQLATTSGIFDYLIMNKLYEGKNPFSSITKRTEKRQKYTAIPDFVIFQIFNNLKLAPFDIMVMYVINYCTGMRVSDICQLEVGNTFTTKGHYFIKHRVQKMKKFQANIIPEAAYKLILQQEAIVKKDNPKGIYLFPSKADKNLPMKAIYYRNKMKELCREWDIRNEDTTPYEFKSHAYRHTIATTLLNDFNVDLSIIQLGVLGHQEINMSLFYAERNQSRKERFQKNYVSIDGSVKRISDEVDDVFLETAEELAESLDKMQLANGMCMLPRKIGVCPHFDACLQCQYFRTSLDYLELHKQQLAMVNRNIPIYEANGWLPNLATAKKEKEGLEKIIAALEKLQQEGGNMNGSNTA